jgi:hypothetical protein
MINFESDRQGQAMRQIPVFKAIEHAFRSTTDNIGFAFHVSWPWLLMLLPLNVATNLYIVLNNIQPRGGAEPDIAALGRFFTASAPLAIASIIAYASIAVNWHRYVLLDEIPQGWNRLRIDSLMWRYIGNFILILLVIMAATAGAAFVVTLAGLVVGSIVGEKTTTILLAPVVLVLYVYAILATYRLSVKLPSVALGRVDFSMKDAWRATGGNMWRLLGVVCLFVAAMLVVGVSMFAITFVFEKFGTVGLSVSIAIQVMVNWVATIFGVTLLTSLYGYFVEGRDF